MRLPNFRFACRKEGRVVAAVLTEGGRCDVVRPWRSSSSRSASTTTMRRRSRAHGSLGLRKMASAAPARGRRRRRARRRWRRRLQLPRDLLLHAAKLDRCSSFMAAQLLLTAPAPFLALAASAAAVLRASRCLPSPCSLTSSSVWFADGPIYHSLEGSFLQSYMFRSPIITTRPIGALCAPAQESRLVQLVVTVLWIDKVAFTN